MPIYYRTFRSFDGNLRRRFRWWVVLKQELRILTGNRMFIGLLILGYLHFLLRVLQIVAMSMLVNSPNSQLAQMLKGMAQLDMFTINETMFFNFLRLQSSIVFITTIGAGAGMICDDVRNNLMEVYFSKPLNWIDYVLGKTMTLILVGLSLTAIPALFLVCLHNVLVPSWATLSATYWYPLPIVLFSLTLVVPCTLGVLASSALFSSQRYAAIGIFMVIFADLLLGRTLPELLRDSSYAACAFPLAINRVGEALFQQKRVLFEFSWQWSGLLIVMACALAAWIICSKIQRAEVAD